jgi:flavodoxin
VNRRTLLKTPFALGAGALLGAAGCRAPAAPPNAEAAAGSRVLLAYFSRAGENYHYGGRTHLEVGNTEVAAEMISASISADVFKIEAADPYPASYQETVDRNVREQNDEGRPEIAGQLPTVETYDTVLLGSPIWNVRPPMIMRTFVERFDWTGKTISPFVTYAVSGLGSTVDDYARLCPGATIKEGLAVRGEEVRDALSVIDTWLRNVGLLAR